MSMRTRASSGFTLIELIVVMAILGALVAMAAPRYVDILERGRLKAQASNLSTLRAAIDAFHGDQGRYPDSLEELVQRRYLRSLPVDPVTEAPDWVTLAPPLGQTGRVWDVRSAAADQELARSASSAGAGGGPAAADPAVDQPVSAPASSSPRP